jgi:hypothetical protein
MEFLGWVALILVVIRLWKLATWLLRKDWAGVPTSGHVAAAQSAKPSAGAEIDPPERILTR